MCRRLLAAVLLAACFCGSAAAQDDGTVRFKWYGFIRNLFVADSRESVYGTADFFYYVPKDRNVVDGVDLNAQMNFCYSAITTRLGVDILGYEVNGWSVSGKIEGDFYAGVTGVTGTASLRLRQACMTLSRDAFSLKAGQSWHPMAADMPQIFSPNTGAPFGPFSRTPELVADWGLGEGFSLTAAAIWQMQYPSAGPAGASADYIKYSGIPELYAGLGLSRGGLTLRAGLDMLSIRPRHLDAGGTRKVRDRITTVSPFLYAGYTAGLFSVRAKTVFAQAGEHVNLDGGYGVTAVDADGTWHYAPTRNSSTWLSLAYGSKVQVVLFGGYVRNFGTAEALLSPELLFFSKNSFSNMNRLLRLTPELICNWGKVSLGFEYELTGIQYGSFGPGDRFGLATQDLHWICNNRVLVMLRYIY